MKIKLRYILIFFFLLLLIASLSYKYFEWSTLNRIVAIYNRTLVEDLDYIEESDKQITETIDLYVELITEGEELEDEEYFKKQEELQGKTRLVINAIESYSQGITQNKDDFTKLREKSKILFGARGKFAKNFLEDHIQYLDLESKVTKRGIIDSYLLLNIFTLTSDRRAMDSFNEKAIDNPERDFPIYYSEVAVLEKYTRSDFKFKKEEEIKKQNPYGYELLERNKEYMSSFYSIVKDYVAEDYESAGYKVSRLSEAEQNLNIDFERVFNEGREEGEDLSKKILETNFTKIDRIKDFKNISLGSYPFLDEVSGWKEDLEMCQLYEYKFDLVENISGSYPTSKNVETLIMELAKIPPKSDSVDSKFNKGVMFFTNNEEEAKFVCLDTEGNREFTFVIEKY